MGAFPNHLHTGQLLRLQTATGVMIGVGGRKARRVPSPCRNSATRTRMGLLASTITMTLLATSSLSDLASS